MSISRTTVLLFYVVLVVCCICCIQAKSCLVEDPTPVTVDTRPGRCPHAQYAFSGLPCSAEGNDTVCPSNYKCCPLTDGMGCFAPCPAWAMPCELDCKFGLKVNPSPCTSCECAEDPCLSATCPRGAVCIVKNYEPCGIRGRCGLATECVQDPSLPPAPAVKPNNCPDYWPGMRDGSSRYLKCNESDSDCLGDQKCCVGPPPFREQIPDPDQRYCVDPCVSIGNCNLSCPLGLLVRGGCRFCQCTPDPCVGYTCPAGKRCRALPAPCYHYRGSPPCPYLPTCM